ncbi:MAG: IPT/TIG domain-containing protein [Acidobacteriia bacterium]|nr:IPT/TIG domain-containing protein [Terriglobia bacterium]
MAVPTLTTVTPSSGPTMGRNQIALTGTNFRVAPVPPPVGYTSDDEQQTVAVWVNGVRCSEAFASSTTTAVAEVPEWRGLYSTLTPCAVDVTIANLSDLGVVITGETVTLTNGYAYGRPSMVAVTPLQRVMEETIALFRRHVLPNTSWIKSRDYDESTSDHLDSTQRATLPMIQLVGPTLADAKDWGNVTPTEELNTGSTTAWHRHQRQKTVHLVWQLDGYTSDRSDNEAINLANAVSDFFTIIKWVQIPADPAAPTGTQWKHEMEMTAPPAFDVAPQGDGLRHFRAEFEVRGVDMGAQDLPVTETGWTAFDPDGPTVAVDGL